MWETIATRTRKKSACPENKSKIWQKKSKSSFDNLSYIEEFITFSTVTKWLKFWYSNMSKRKEIYLSWVCFSYKKLKNLLFEFCFITRAVPRQRARLFCEPCYEKGDKSESKYSRSMCFDIMAEVVIVNNYFKFQLNIFDSVEDTGLRKNLNSKIQYRRGMQVDWVVEVIVMNKYFTFQLNTFDSVEDIRILNILLNIFKQGPITLIYSIQGVYRLTGCYKEWYRISISSYSWILW